MKLMGISDEAANAIDGQIQATRKLGWKYIEMRGVEVPGFPKGNFHEIQNEAFDIAVKKLQAADIQIYCFGSTVMNWSKKVVDPFENTLAEVCRIIPRMQRLGTTFIRIMSYKPDDDADRILPHPEDGGEQRRHISHRTSPHPVPAPGYRLEMVSLCQWSLY
jgi:hypothetical protein